MEELESGTPADLEVNAPPGLLPNLSDWGIDEVQKGVCEDTADNRRAIRQNKGKFQTVFDINGMPTGYLQVVSAEMYSAAQALSKADLLADQDDHNSEYLSGLKLLLAPDAKNIAPSWVLNTTRVFIQQQERRRELGADADLMQSRLITPPKRCAVMNSDGTRCWGWSNGAVEMGGMCRLHARRAGKSPSITLSVEQTMRLRLKEGAPAMLDRLEALADSADERIASNATNSWLDRAGYKAVDYTEQTVKVEVTEGADLVKERLAKLRKGLEDKDRLLKQVKAEPDGTVVEAEVVEDE